VVRVRWYPLSVPTVGILAIVVIVVHPLVVPFYVMTIAITNVSIATTVVFVSIDGNSVAITVGILIAFMPVYRIGSDTVVATLVQLDAVTTSRHDITYVRTLSTARRCLQHIVEPQLARFSCVDVHNITAHGSLRLL